MGFRFQKRIRIFKGLTLNLSKSGTSWTVGGKGASINVCDDKATSTAGIPGVTVPHRASSGTGEATGIYPRSGQTLIYLAWRSSRRMYIEIR